MHRCCQNRCSLVSVDKGRSSAGTWSNTLISAQNLSGQQEQEDSTFACAMYMHPMQYVRRTPAALQKLVCTLAQIGHQQPSGNPPARLAVLPWSGPQSSQCTHLGSHATWESSPGHSRNAAALGHPLLHHRSCVLMQDAATLMQ